MLRLVARRVAGPVTLVLDNAKYQRCALVQGLGVELLYLPPYSPNLHLIERLWRFVKKECLRAVYHATYDDFTGAIDQCLATLGTTHKAAMGSLLTHNFQTFDDVPKLAA